MIDQSDKERLDFLENLPAPDGASRWLLRESTTGRGFRLTHLGSTSVGFKTVREAIDNGVVSREKWKAMVREAFDEQEVY